VSEKNDIYSREKRLETLLEKIRENRGSKNADNLLGYGKYMLLNGIGVERREKVIRTLYLVSQWQEKPFVQMERADLEGIVERIERSKESEWTKHDYEVIIKKFFKWLRKTEEYPPEVKWIKPKNVKNGKLPEDLLTKEEVSRMIDCAQNPRDKAMIAVLYESGCRVGELCNLNIKDITFDEYGCVVLFPRGKTGPRRVRLAFSTPFLATWIDNHPLKDPDSWLWVNLGQTNRNEAMRYAGVNKMLRSVAKKAGVKIVAGDTKVVERGGADKVYINTTGIGSYHNSRSNTLSFEEGDVGIVSGSVGDHGVAVLAARGEFGINATINSDCASLNHMLAKVYEESSGIRIIRDPTRGGLATTLVEIAEDFCLEIVISEEKIPVKDQVHGMCDLVGFDPYYLANEGKAILIVANSEKEKIMNILAQFPEGIDATIIGKLTGKAKGRLLLETPLGSKRLLTRLSGTMLPRIC